MLPLPGTNRILRQEQSRSTMIGIWIYGLRCERVKLIDLMQLTHTIVVRDTCHPDSRLAKQLASP
ncbi:hypothetical protein BK654_03070 [Pseudomonas brassicacearum]|nr:hypothetical protein BK654_03070 [Pseudomonas brassicacearum]